MFWKPSIMPDSMGIVEFDFGAVSMPLRRIDQEVLGFRAKTGQLSGLEELSALIERNVIDRLFDRIHCAAKGKPAWPLRPCSRLC